MILSVSIITQSGSPLVARQFNHFSRSQLEGHLGAFPKLISNSSQSYIETESIRYVFQAIGKLYFVLITSKNSNIIEDLDVLSLLIDLTCTTLNVSDSEITEDLVYQSQFELIFAYDECIFDGYYQDVSVSDVSTFLAMESQEEDEFNRNRKAKEDAAAQQLRQRMKELENQRKAQNKANRGFSKGSNYQQVSSSSIPAAVIPMKVDTEQERSKPSRRPASNVKGMSLGRKTTARDKAEQMIKEEGLTLEDRRSRASGQAQSAFSNQDNDDYESPAPPPNGVLVKLTEVMKASVTRQSAVKELAVEGRLTAESAEKGQFAIKLALSGNSDKFKTRPLNQKDRKLFQQKKQLVFDNKGAEGTLLGWRYTSVDPEDVPLSFSCWVTDGKDDQNRQISTFCCEVSLNKPNLTFQNIILSIFVPHVNEAKISNCDGEKEISMRDSLIRWIITDIDQDNPAEIEFSVPRCNEDEFFPINVEFQSDSLYYDASIESVAKIDANGNCDFNDPAKFEVVKSFSSAEFQIT